MATDPNPSWRNTSGGAAPGRSSISSVDIARRSSTKAAAPSLVSAEKAQRPPVGAGLLIEEELFDLAADAFPIDLLRRFLGAFRNHRRGFFPEDADQEQRHVARLAVVDGGGRRRGRFRHRHEVLLG